MSVANTESSMTLSQSMDSVNTVAEEEVRTLFVSGLPMDAKPRELYLLFRAYKGYEGSLLKVTQKNGKTSSPVGFVTFSSRAGAEAAKQELQKKSALPCCRGPTTAGHTTLSPTLKCPSPLPCTLRLSCTRPSMRSCPLR